MKATEKKIRRLALPRHLVGTLMLVCLSLTAITPLSIPPAYACDDCANISAANPPTRQVDDDEHDENRDHIDAEFDSWEDWLLNTFAPPFRQPFYDLAQQIVTAAVYQIFAIGTLLDGKQALETQRLFQKLRAEAYRDYQPSIGVCTVGTTVRSLAASERWAETTTFVLSQRATDRQIGNMHTAAAAGGESDKKSRLEQFRRRYCDTHDNNDTFAAVCTTANGSRNATINKDIDYGRTVDQHHTMNIDFSNTTITDDEEDVMALASNLYSHDVFNRIEEGNYNDKDPNTSNVSKQSLLIDQRAIMAKRSVAENSFNTIVGLKAYGSPQQDPEDPAIGDSVDTRQYLYVILQELGMATADIDLFLGTRPSYFTQMEVLTKKAFQQPTFFADLYDKPANVDRKKVALQAVGLMQDFDMWQSYLRTEAMLSVMLELEIEKRQSAIENPITGENK